MTKETTRCRERDIRRSNSHAAARRGRSTFDVAILGGGPAGAVAGTLLAREGVRVALVDSTTTEPPRLDRLEGLSIRSADGLRRARLDAACEELGDLVPRRAYWGGGIPQANGEYLVGRAAFDAALRRDAVNAGVNFLRNTVRHVRRLPDGVSRVVLEDGAAISAPLIIDARGRRASGAGQRMRGPRSFALCRFVEDARLAHSMVESGRSGWIWYACSGAGYGLLAAFADAAQFASRHDLDGIIDNIAQDCGQVRKMLAGSRTLGAPTTRNAGFVLSDPVVEPGLIRIGDAALAIDPLSGNGIFLALSAALAVVPMVATLLEDGEDTLETVRDFHESRCQDTFHRQARIGRDFYRLAGLHGDRRYWQPRQSWPDDLPAHASSDGQLLIKDRPVVQDKRIRMRSVVVTPDRPLGIGWIDGVPLAPIVRSVLSLPWMQRPLLRDDLGNTAAPRTAQLIWSWLEHRKLVPTAIGPTESHPSPIHPESH